MAFFHVHKLNVPFGMITCSRARAQGAGQYRVVAVVVSFTENALRDKMKAAGGRWDPEKKVWHVLYGSIRGDTELEERILPD